MNDRNDTSSMNPRSSENNPSATEIPAASRLEWSPKNSFIATLFVVCVLLGLWLLYNYRSVVIIFLVAIILGTGMKPIYTWLAGHGIAPVISKALIFVLILGLILSFLGLTLPVILNQTKDLTDQLSEYYLDLRGMLINSPSEIMRGIGLRLSARLEAEDLAPPSPAASSAQAPSSPTQDTVNLVANSFHSASLIFNGVLAFLAVFLLAFYWTIEGERVIRSMLLLAPVDKRNYLQEIFTAIEAKLGGFLLGQFVLCLVIGVMSLVAYLLIGLPNAFILAIIAGILEAVPVVGPGLGALPALAVALIIGPEKAILVLLATAIIQLLENNWLVPRIMDRAVGVHPILTLVSLAVFYSVLGFGGAVLAVPIAAIFQFLINRFVLLPLQDPVLVTEGRDYSSLLQLKAREITTDLRHQNSKLDADKESTQAFQEQIEAVADELVQILKQHG